MHHRPTTLTRGRQTIILLSVRITRTPDFEEESVRYSLRFCCEDCGHFDAAQSSCRHFWPTDVHRKDHHETRAVPLIDFCKEFELC